MRILNLLSDLLGGVRVVIYFGGRMQYNCARAYPPDETDSLNLRSSRQQIPQHFTFHDINLQVTDAH
jgi:hypothetical protein